eukprot:4667025-Pyramimonas_sp.AAC.1
MGATAPIGSQRSRPRSEPPSTGTAAQMAASESTVEPRRSRHSNRLHRAFQVHVPGNSAHGRRAGKQANQARVQQGRVAEQGALRRARQARLSGKVLVVSNCVLLRVGDEAAMGGPPGMWGLLHEHCGAWNAPVHH